MDALTRAGLKAGKAKLSGVALEHHAAGEANFVAGGYVDFKVRVFCPHGFDGGGDWKSNRIGVAQSVEALALGKTNLDLLGKVFFRFRREVGFVAHLYCFPMVTFMVSINLTSPTLAATMILAAPW